MKASASPRLKRGETVGVVSPGFAVKPSLLRAGVRRIESLGFRVELGRHVLARDGYLAGDDDARLADLSAMFCASEVRAIWFSRGGYGTARLLERLPWRRLRRDPKLLIGYSDLTALFCEALKFEGQRCLYGPVVSELGDRAAYHRPSLNALLAGRSLELKLRAGQVLFPGCASGRLVGGNLAVISHLAGTPFAPDLRGAILFIEEVGEETYRVDRMLTQLRSAGMLREIRGVVAGCFSVPSRRRFPPDRPLETVFREAFGPLGIPVITDVPAGHVKAKRTLPLGAAVDLDTDARRLCFVP